MKNSINMVTFASVVVFLFALLTLPSAAFASWSSSNYEINSIQVANNGSYVVSVGSGTIYNPDSCSITQLILPNTVGSYDEISKLFISAYLSGKNIYYLTDGCNGGYIKIRAVRF